ncbi:hypothetical protein RUM44_003141 [Polyplax serrata]|uniref:Uncharacterized protein n=1 Tax=Polyplax serrata TaxID=468196 RepID=A0ABR1AZ60_POLSC
MAYLPYRMHGSGGFHLPIIDIVQTFNSPSRAVRRLNPTKAATSHSSKGLYSSQSQDDKSDSSSKKSASQSCFTKELVLKDAGRDKYRKNSIPSKTQLFKSHRTNNQIGTTKDKTRNGDSKCLRILFKAAKGQNMVDRNDEPEEEEIICLAAKSSVAVKRKASFVVSSNITEPHIL